MKDLQLNDIDIEDIEDVIKKIETSFDVKFVANELVHISKFGELCDYIENKMQLENTTDCSSQQAFYKLRDSVSSSLPIDKRTITPDSALKDLFPRHNRRLNIFEVERKLGFKLNILRPPYWLTSSLVIAFLASIFGLFIYIPIGLVGIVLSTSGLYIAATYGKELDLVTVGQVAEKMSRENYLKARHDSKTINKKEIEKIVFDLFIYELDLDRTKLTRDARFFK